MKKQRLLLVFHSVYPVFIAAFYHIPGVRVIIYKVVQIWPGLFVCKQVTVYPGHIWTTLYLEILGSGRMKYSKLYTENHKY
jgi:hypothetical protein